MFFYSGMRRRGKLGQVHVPAIAVLAFALSGATTAPAGAEDEFAKGVDLSILKKAEDSGVVYRQGGRPADAIEIFKSSGVNWVRLRLFVSPDGKDGQVNTFEYTLALAKRVKRAKLHFYLDLHYSDRWADAVHQAIPDEWKDLPHDRLARVMHDYTVATLKDFSKAGCEPEMVSIGNEITNGMIWPAGGPMNSERRWPPLIELLRAGCSAVRDVSPDKRIRIMIHLDKGGRAAVSEDFFNHCQKADLDFDVMGLSYYPFWHGTLNELKQNLAALSAKYDRDIYVAETGYGVSGPQGKLPYPTTPDGQKQFLEALINVVASTPRGHGKGVFYWEPAWIDGPQWNGPSWSSTWEDRALFDAGGNPRPAMSAFNYKPEAEGR